KSATLKGHSDSVRGVAFSRQDGRLASGGWDTTLRVWNPAARRPQLFALTLPTWVWTVAYAPDGWALAAGLGNGEIVVYPGGPKRVQYVLTGHHWPVTSLAFSPNSRVLASGGQDRTIRVWRAEFGHLITTLTGHTDWVRCVAFGSDGR